MSHTVDRTQFSFPGQTSFYSGKVRDVYTIDDLIVLIASDRISAFDHILPRAIPYKGQVLNQLAAYFLQATKDVVPNWYIASPDPNVSVGYACEPYRVEMVIRGYLTGHAWRTYQSGLRTLCGVNLPEGMVQNQKLPHPIITPTTKAMEGHDEDISRAEIIARGIVSEADYKQMEEYTHQLFQLGTEMALERGLILVDTKYEFGNKDGQIMIIDEIHTPDSSRYFYADTYQDCQNQSLPQKQLSKEFVREWLIENGFQGRIGEVIPEMTDAWVQEISEKYIYLYEQLTQQKFVPASNEAIGQRISANIQHYLKRR